jgi:hypothetical protein
VRTEGAGECLREELTQARHAVTRVPVQPMGPAEGEDAEAAGRGGPRKPRGGERVVVENLAVRERDRLQAGVLEPFGLLFRG